MRHWVRILTTVAALVIVFPLADYHVMNEPLLYTGWKACIQSQPRRNTKVAESV
ncbi:hypothetical protein BH18THE2_BH18THE2_14820 [soil metagenome]